MTKELREIIEDFKSVCIQHGQENTGLSWERINDIESDLFIELQLLFDSLKK